MNKVMTVDLRGYLAGCALIALASGARESRLWFRYTGTVGDEAVAIADDMIRALNISVNEKSPDCKGPDWSQAPSWAICWFITPDRRAYWSSFVPEVCANSGHWAFHRKYSVHGAPLFGYAGSWEASRRIHPDTAARIDAAIQEDA